MSPKKNLKLSDSELRFRFSDGFFRFLATAADLSAEALAKVEGGEMGSDYFQNTQHFGFAQCGKICYYQKGHFIINNKIKIYGRNT